MGEPGRQPFIGSEALAAGDVSLHELGKYYTALMPNVYLDSRLHLSLRQRIRAALLWSGRQAVVAGAAASALHGAKWVPDDAVVELIWRNAKAPRGVKTRDDLLLEGETQWLGGMGVTTAERTAFDLGRRDTLGQAVARLDALARATGFKSDDVTALADGHRHTRGRRQLKKALDLIDAGAQSPKETWLRLLLVGAGFPRPQTQIPVLGPDVTPDISSTWGGRTSCSPSNTTATITGRTDRSTSRTSPDWNTSARPAGLTSGCWPSTGAPMSSVAFSRPGTR